MEDLVTLEKKVMTVNSIKDQDIVKCIETSADNTKYWVDKSKVVENLHIKIEDLQQLIQNSQTIVINKLGQLTTRKLYKEKTPFFDKLLDSIKNRID